LQLGSGKRSAMIPESVSEKVWMRVLELKRERARVATMELGWAKAKVVEQLGKRSATIPGSVSERVWVRVPQLKWGKALMKTLDWAKERALEQFRLDASKAAQG
jgi:hypothetical protein